MGPISLHGFFIVFFLLQYLDMDVQIHDKEDLFRVIMKHAS